MINLHNRTVSTVTFLLSGIPGMEEYYTWLALPLCCFYINTLIANIIVLVVIEKEENLHLPMYFFISMLMAADLVVSNTFLPKFLSLLLFNSREISFEGCLIQMFLVMAFTVMVSSILLAMAFDRYIAICNPLRYTTIINKSVLTKIACAVIFKGVLLALPLPFYFQSLPFCRSTEVAYTYCESLAVAKLACAEITFNYMYGMVLAALVGGFDSISILLSYVWIVRTIFKMPSKDSRHKAVSTCTAHISVILIGYVPGLLTGITSRFGTNSSLHFQTLLPNLYLVVSPMANPIIFGLKTKEIQKKILHLLKPSSLLLKNQKPHQNQKVLFQN
ncbi:olfactory receptor 52D1-like [Pleurodeles waltl]|uniref:olfactory receptor 52D1-like n=1 Tax=Pleurodeles waltl TaxID=8319 RepID=UPI0037094D50